MDYGRENGFCDGNVVQILSGNENWGVGAGDQAVWATEDDYGMWNDEENSRLSQSRSESEPPNKRSRNSGDLVSSNRAKAIGKMFYKTKLCCKFRAGTCPYITNCNFAHSVEELRKPPPNWQDIVAAHEEESSEPREEFQIPILGVTDDAQRSYKGRHCKKFYTEEGCPYGENCTFLHDEHSKARESVAISLGPGSGAGGGYGNNANGSMLKPSNWKTRICNKWELTGYCPFGSKCHFAHGNAEVKDSIPDAKAVKTSVDTVVASVVPSDNYQRLSNVTGHRRMQKWKGPDKISKIYGDWIDDL